MARLGRAQPNRPLISRSPRQRGATIRPATIHLTTRIHAPGITAESPNATIRPNVIHVRTRIHAPTITTQRAATIRPATIHLTTRIRGPHIPAVPGAQVTQEGQLWFAAFGGQLMGAGTAYELQKITGWTETAPAESGSMERPGREGGWAGRKKLKIRVVTAELQIRAASLAAFAAAAERLEDVMAIPEDTSEQLLVVQINGRRRRAMAAALQCLIDHPVHREVFLAKAVVQWELSNPYRYGFGMRQAQISPGGSASVTNGGNRGARPTIIVPGPATNPLLTHTPSGRRIGYNLILDAGEILVIDCDAGTATQDGVSVLPGLTAGCVPPEAFTLPPGTTSLAYSVTAGSVPVDVTWRDPRG